MTIEQSHGKARPTLPRSSDLAPVPDAALVRVGERDEAGRFIGGNTTGRGRGWKMTIAGSLGRDATDDEARAVAQDAWRLFAAAVREMPSDGPTVRGLLVMRVRHEALAAFWSNRAAAVGLTTDAGIAAQDQATKHGQRAERLAVTALDVATKLATKRAPDTVDFTALAANAEAETGRRREAERAALVVA